MSNRRSPYYGSRRSKAKLKKMWPLLLLLLLYLAWDYFQSPTPLLPDQPAAPAAPVVSSDYVYCQDDLELHFIDVGQADCTLVRCGGQSMLVDGGNSEDLELISAYLDDLGVEQLDYIVCTHAHEDHAGSLSHLLARYPAELALAPYETADNRWFEDFVAVIDDSDTQLVVPQPGDQYDLGGAEFTVLGPLLEYENVNDSSLVLRLVYGDTAMLLTGDATTTAETDMLEAGFELSADVLKLGHHGSNGSTGYRFLREVTPDYAVISCGVDNSYGHPGEKTMSRLRDQGATVYRTDQQGSIICRSDGEAISFFTQK